MTQQPWQRLVPAQGPGEAPVGEERFWSHKPGLALGLPQAMPGSRPRRERGLRGPPRHGLAWLACPPVSPPSLAETRAGAIEPWPARQLCLNVI